MGRFWLFSTSLSPALLIVFIRLVPKLDNYAWYGIVASVLLFFGSYLLVMGRKRIGVIPISPKNVQDETMQIPTYLITFIFPFLFISDTPSCSTIVAYACFLVFLLALLFRTDMAIVNPALLIAGYHVYTVETDSDIKYVIAKGSLRIKNDFHAYPVDGNLYLATDK